MKNPDQQLKIALTSMLISLLIVVTGLAFVYKKDQQELRQKDLKISVLIDEVGQIKDQNEKFYQNFTDEKNNIQKTAIQMGNIEQKLGNINLNSAEQKQIQQDMAAVNDNLLQLVQKKNQTIQSLQQQNDIVAQNLSNSGKMPGYLNVLIVGENMQLTDTIMLASVNSKNKKITLISIPRDLFYNGRKINEYYEKYGIDELENVISAITGIVPDKYVILNMEAFKKIVDDVGGIDINVLKNITDNLYPGPNYSYIKVSFSKGQQHIDGNRALQYARSRKSTTDFDRTDRQQQIIGALKQKAEELNLKGNIEKLTQFYNDVKDDIKTDITLLDALNYYDQYQTYQLDSGNVISNQNFLYSTYSSSGQYILLPYKGSFMPVQNYVKNLIGA